MAIGGAMSKLHFTVFNTKGPMPIYQSGGASISPNGSGVNMPRNQPQQEQNHSRREQHPVPDDVRTREEYSEWMRTLPRVSSDVIPQKQVVPAAVAIKATVRKVSVAADQGKARA